MNITTSVIGTKELELYCSRAVIILNRVKKHDDYPDSDVSVLACELKISRDLASEIVANLRHNGKRYIL